jgi:hypothetical protein
MLKAEDNDETDETVVRMEGYVRFAALEQLGDTFPATGKVSRNADLEKQFRKWADATLSQRTEVNRAMPKP